MIYVFGFLTFLYLKIATEFFFYDGITVLGALLVAIFYTGVLHFAQIVSLGRVMMHALRYAADPIAHFWLIAAYHLAATLLSVLAALAICYGFTAHLRQELFGGWHVNYPDIALYSALVAFPGIVATIAFWAFSRGLLLEHFRR